MKKLILLFIVVSLFFSLNQGPVVQAKPNEPASSAKSMILMEQKTGRILAGNNFDEVLPIASLTKIVTCLTVIENSPNLDKTIVIPTQAIGVEGTSIYLKAGEKLSIRELLHGLMLQSGNDAANALAIAVGNDISSFCEMMNKTAKKYGALSSNFCNPHGLDIPGHYSTAKDLANITRHALNNEDFAKIVSCKTFTISGDETTTRRCLKNKNKLLFRFDGATGVKTGFTKKAGRCLVSSCERDGLKLVCVVLNCGPMFEESEGLFKWGYKNFRMREILAPYQACGEARVIGGEKERVELFCPQGFSYPLTDDEYMRVKTEFSFPKTLNAPFSKEKNIGTVEIKLDNELLFKSNIYTMEGVKSTLIKNGIKDLINKWFK